MLRRSFLRLLGLAPVAAPMAVAAATAPAVRALGVSTLAVGKMQFDTGALGASDWPPYSSAPLAEIDPFVHDPETGRSILAMRRTLAANGVEATHLIGPAEVIRPHAVGDAEPTYLDLYAPEDLTPEGC